MSDKPKVLAYFLPQYHSCEYNNKWWGEGFTEWNNVRVANKLFEDHYQPRVPLEGYYDLLSDGELGRQYAQAKAAGIDGFSIYHYWYEGKKPLGSVVEKILADKSIEMNFSLCWANHSWTRTWRNHSGALDVLVEQTYEKNYEDLEPHFEFLDTCFMDERYIRLNGKPLFQIYIPEDIADLEAFIDQLRGYFKAKRGIEIHISATVRRKNDNFDYLNIFDSVTLNQPTLALFSSQSIFSTEPTTTKISKKVLREKILQSSPLLKKYIFRLWDLLPSNYATYDYASAWESLISQSKKAIADSEIPVNLTAFVEFDNTPRYGKRAKIITGFSPEIFGKYLSELHDVSSQNGGEVLFINAWNEWGEGMYLQDDDKYQNRKLEAVAAALRK